MREAKDDEVNEMSPADMKLKAIEVADADMKKGGADLSLYRIEIVEDSISFKIHYILKDSLMLLGGGGGMVRVSKRDFAVIGGYQDQ